MPCYLPLRRCPPLFPSHHSQVSSRFIPSSHRAADYVKESGLPSFLNEATLEVQTPSGKQTLPNPFLGYTIDRCGGWMAVAGKWLLLVRAHVLVRLEILYGSSCFLCLSAMPLR